jgi:hypothetical protein
MARSRKIQVIIPVAACTNKLKKDTSTPKISGRVNRVAAACAPGDLTCNAKNVAKTIVRPGLEISPKAAQGKRIFEITGKDGTAKDAPVKTKKAVRVNGAFVPIAPYSQATPCATRRAIPIVAFTHRTPNAAAAVAPCAMNGIAVNGEACKQTTGFFVQ